MEKKQTVTRKNNSKFMTFNKATFKILFNEEKFSVKPSCENNQLLKQGKYVISFNLLMRLKKQTKNVFYTKLFFSLFLFNNKLRKIYSLNF